MKKIVKLRKSGNSLAISIPKEMAQALRWKEGDYILLEIKMKEKTAYETIPNYLIASKIEEET